MTVTEIILLILVVLLIIGLAIICIKLFKKGPQVNNDADFYKYLKEMNDDNNRKNEELVKKISESNKTYYEDTVKQNRELNKDFEDFKFAMNKNFGEMNEKVDANIKEGFKTNADTIAKVNESLGKITEAQKNLDGLASEVTNLNNVLSNSQQRGRFGEVTLEMILDNVFGETKEMYATQYALTPNDRPDAVVFINDGNKKVICIDSKFSFNDYQKLFNTKKTPAELDSLKSSFLAALKNQVTKIGNAYIKKELTINYAIMFIPSDGIYAYIQSDDMFDGLLSYARQKNVVLCSPSTLQPILVNLRTININANVKSNLNEILRQINSLRETCVKIEEKWESFDSTLQTLNNKREDLNKQFNQFASKSEKVLSLGKFDQDIEEIK